MTTHSSLDALSCDSIEFSISEDIDLLSSRYFTNCFSQIAVTLENSEISDLASKSFSNVSISSVICATLALSSEMLVSSVEMLTLSCEVS